MIQFAWPWIFLLTPLPWLVYRFLPRCNADEGVALKVPELADFNCFQKPSTRSFFNWNVLIAFMMWLALLGAAARPQWVGDPVEIPRSGRDLMLAVDLSYSMRMDDFKVGKQKVDRLTALKLIAGDFIERRKGDRIGLILFGSQAYLQTPLTFDLSTVKQLLDEAAIGLAGKETAIGDAIGLAVKQMRDSPQKSRVLILLTDGNNNVGELTPEKAAELAEHAQLKIYTVAIGAKEAVVQTIFGKQKVNPSADLDEKTLMMIAEKTGGEYFRAYNTEDLARIYKHIDSIEAVDRDVQFYRPIDELYLWPLSAALSFAALLLLSNSVKRRFA